RSASFRAKARTCCARGVKLFIVRWRRTVSRFLRQFTDIRFREDFQTLADNFGTKMIAFFRGQFLLRAFLKMCWLGVDEQLVNGQPAIFWKSAEVDPEFNDRKQVERFLGGHGMSKSKHTVRPTDLI